MQLELNCLIYGDDLNSSFTINISDTETVSILREFIWDKQGFRLSRLGADRAEPLTLWKLCPSIPYAEIDRKQDNKSTLDLTILKETAGCVKLLPLDILLNHFSLPTPGNIHIIVELPPTRWTMLYMVSLLFQYLNSLWAFRPSNHAPSNMGERLAAFHHQSWGHPLDCTFTTLPTYLESEEDILPGEPFLNILDTSFLVRAEYIRALNAVQAISDEDQRGYLAVVTGQPGIGKTLWIYYALRYCLGRKQSVIWYRGGKFYLFSNVGVKSFQSTDEFNPHFTWCFVDSTAADPLPDKIYDPLNGLFPIYVTAPKEERWKKLYQLRRHKLVIMNPWTKPELEKAAKLYPNQNLTEIFGRFDDAGPTARLCLLYSPAEIKDFYAARDVEINFRTISGMVDTLLDGKSQRLRIGDISQQLCVVRRLDSQNEPYIVEPISASIRYRLLIQLKKWKDRDRVEMMEHFSRVQGAAGMVGLLFESHYQHQFAKKIEIDLTQMFRAPNLRSRWHAKFGDFSKSSKLYEASQKASSTRQSLSITPSECRTYDHDKSKLMIQENIYYVPSAENEVAIDSFIVHGGHLYMFQFASGLQHSVNPGLLTTLERLSGLPPVAVRHLIFIVPQRLDKFSCPHSDSGFLQDHVPFVAKVGD